MHKFKRALALGLAACASAAFLASSVHSYLANRSFVDFTNQMFLSEIKGNTLNLHYTLSNPEAFGILDYAVTLGTADAAQAAASSVILENYQDRMEGICRHCLSDDNQLTYDILESYLENQEMGREFYLYEEPLGPTIGVQAQLPVLLAEYTFRNERDVTDYLELVRQMDSYYASILKFEQEKAKAGLFMSDAAADQVIAQCSSFIETPEQNFMLEIFDEQMETADFLSQEQKESYKKANRQAVLDHVIPAYELLIQGLADLKGQGVNEQGLCYLPQGKDYYEYLVRDTTGLDQSIPDLAKRIQQQLESDFSELRTLLSENPSLLTGSYSGDLALQNPSSMLKDLEEKISQDFPEAPDVSFEVKYVHSSLEDFLSPAFYLTPPIDDQGENIIYINQASSYTPLELYATLAHEGYPGHLYQTVYFGNTGFNKVRSLMDFGGYVEGWATYVEMYSYSMADTDQNAAALYRLNRSIMLGISSLMDIAIHYYGYSRSDAAAYLIQLGFSDTTQCDALYDAILESPANYLKYYGGYLGFLDLRAAYAQKQQDQFSLKDFHEKVLETGPAPFSVLEKQLGV